MTAATVTRSPTVRLIGKRPRSTLGATSSMMMRLGDDAGMGDDAGVTGVTPVEFVGWTEPRIRRGMHEALQNVCLLCGARDLNHRRYGPRPRRKHSGAHRTRGS